MSVVICYQKTRPLNFNTYSFSNLMSPRTTTTRPRVFLYLDSLEGPGRVGSLYVCICLYCQYVKTSNAQEMWLYGEKLVFWRIIAFLSNYATKIVAIRRRKSAGHVTKIVYKFHVNADFSPHSFWLVTRTHDSTQIARVKPLEAVRCTDREKLSSSSTALPTYNPHTHHPH